jgi:hypothetical protein
MYKGAHLTLLIGNSVPVPAPKLVVDAIQSVRVTSGKDRSGFQITFSVDKKSPLLNVMLPAGFFDPVITRVIIVVTLNGIPNVLMDGFITNQEFAPSNEAGGSTLTITGEDLSLAMDMERVVHKWVQMPEAVIVNTIVEVYASLGIIPVVIPPIIQIIKDRSQTNTDRSFIKSLANACGYVFFIQPGPAPGRSIAYFGPDVHVPIPQSAVSINLDAHSNAESMSFSLNGLAKQIKMFTVMDPVTGTLPTQVPLPNIDIFKPPLGLRPTPIAQFDLEDESAKLSPVEAAQAILGFLMNSSAAITGNGTLDVSRYNQILRARMLVGVRGAGLAYDGFYYVDSVTHNIKKGEYKQSFSLSRDGFISNTPVVPVV